MLKCHICFHCPFCCNNTGNSPPSFNPYSMDNPLRMHYLLRRGRKTGGGRYIYEAEFCIAVQQERFVYDERGFLLCIDLLARVAGEFSQQVSLLKKKTRCYKSGQIHVVVETLWGAQNQALPTTTNTHICATCARWKPCVYYMCI